MTSHIDVVVFQKNDLAKKLVSLGHFNNALNIFFPPVVSRMSLPGENQLDWTLRVIEESD